MDDEEKIKELVSQASPIYIRSELFRNGNFDFIVTGKNEYGDIVTHEKQREALKILTSNEYEEFLYGGAAGGAKSWTGCAWIMFMAICYPNTKYFIARNELKDIIDSVLVTFNKVARMYGFTDYKYNAVKNFIQFGNGSHINFIEIKYKPSDPMFEDVGSTEYTCGWIEEVGEIHQTGAAVIASRVGRHLNGKFGIKGIVFYTCNPKQNWAKTDFYDKHLSGTLELDKKYLSCLITENPFIESDYVNKLKKIGEKDKSLYERLFMGNWDYEDNPNQLCEQEMVEQVFDNDQVPQGRTYLTADVARMGNDMTVIGVWRGWRLIEIQTIDRSKLTEAQDYVNQLRRKYQIPKNRCIADEDGVGGGVVDNCGILGFKNGSTPLKEKGIYADKKDVPTYRNLQIQCLYHLADRVNEGGIWVMADIDSKQKKEIKQEFSQIIRKTSDYGKLDLKPKSEIKKDIGRSPDYRDMILMRVYFDLKQTKQGFVGSRKRGVL